MGDAISRREELVAANRRQQEFFDQKTTESLELNPVMSLWSNRRKAMERYRKEIGVSAAVRELKRSWIEQARGANVLELGCGKGSKISLELASISDSYLGIDLSEESVRVLRQRLDEQGIENAEVLPLDFLSERLPGEPYDLIYANAVVHHFEDLQMFLELLNDRLVPGGTVVTWDPMETSWPVWVVRKLYRPFQRDAEWEWPFRKETFRAICSRFEIAQMEGQLGLSKWGFLIANVPMCWKLGVALGRKWHERDRESSRMLGRGLWRCMSVSMQLKKSPVAPSGEPNDP